jgi:hypothetical protein
MEGLCSFKSPLLIYCLQICGAIQEYQTQLIDSIKEDIKHLHKKVISFFSYPSYDSDDFLSVQNTIPIF